MSSAFASDPGLESARQRAEAGAWAEVLVLLGGDAGVAHGSEGALLYGEALMRLGREREAVDHLLRIEPGLRESRDRVALRRAVNMLGVSRVALGQLDAAGAALGEALELATEDEDLLVLARATNNLGAVANMQGDHERALSHYRLALPTFQRLGQHRGLAASYHNIAITCRDLGQLDDADEHERRAIEHATQAGAPRLAAMGRVGRAEVALRRGDARLAEITARLSADELQRLGDPLNEADAHRLVGAACAALGQLGAAHEAFDRALEIARARGHALNEAETLRDRSEMLLRDGRREEGVADARAAIALFGRLGASVERTALERRLATLD
jgi:tetratricopeptide (TPR) repeat protein